MEELKSNDLSHKEKYTRLEEELKLKFADELKSNDLSLKEKYTRLEGELKLKFADELESNLKDLKLKFADELVINDLSHKEEYARLTKEWEIKFEKELDSNLKDLKLEFAEKSLEEAEQEKRIADANVIDVGISQLCIAISLAFMAANGLTEDGSTNQKIMSSICAFSGAIGALASFYSSYKYAKSSDINTKIIRLIPLISNIINIAAGIVFATKGTSTLNISNIFLTAASSFLSVCSVITLISTIRADRHFKENSLAAARKNVEDLRQTLKGTEEAFLTTT